MHHQSEYDTISEYLTEKRERRTRDKNLPIWNFFEKSGDGKKYAYCNCCSNKLSYKTSITNLKSHLKKHKKEYRLFLKLTESQSHNKWATAARNSKSEKEENEMTFENEDIDCDFNSSTPKDSDCVIWTFFEKSNDETETAICNFCSKRLSYETKLTDLKDHLKIEHITEYNNFLNLVEQLEPAPENSKSGNEFKVTLENKEFDNGSLPTFVIETVEDGRNSPSTSAHDLSSDDKKSEPFERRPKSISLPVWKFFRKLSNYNKIAVCNRCSRKLSYKTTITNLKAHLKVKHPSDYKMLLDLTKQFELEPENMRTSSPTHSDNERRLDHTSVVWKFFKKSRSGNRIAVCNYCSRRLSYRATISNIKSHLKMKHKKEYRHFLKLTEQHKLATALRNSKSENEENEMTLENEDIGFAINSSTPKDSDCVLWTFFEKTNDEAETAICNFCSKRLSYETKLTDLKEHLKIEHITEYNNFLNLVEQLEPPSENSKSGNEYKVTLENKEFDNGSPPTFVIETVEGGRNSPPTSTHDLSSDDEKSVHIERRQRSISLPLWKFFKKLDNYDKIAVCNRCSRKLSYKTTITNLKAHLKVKHPSDYEMLLDLTKQSELAPENVRTSSSTHSNNERRLRRKKNTSVIWNFFEKPHSGKKIAVCNYCSKKLSYKTTITNLKTHLKNLHPSEYTIFYELTKQVKSVKTSEDSASDSENTENNRSRSEIVVEKRHGKYGNGIIWNFFEESRCGKRNAVCNYCDKTLSYKTTITNLKQHLQLRHKSEYKIYVELKKQLRDVRKRLQNSTSDIEETENVRPSTSEDGAKNNRIWKYYERSKYGHWIAICNYCHKDLSYQSTIINLITHLKEEHNEIYREYMQLKSRKRRHSSLSSDYAMERSDGASEPGQQNNRMRPKCSVVWRYFEEQTKERAVCRICERVITRKFQSTTNLRSHIRHSHPVDFEDLIAIECNRKISAKAALANDRTPTSRISRKPVPKWPKEATLSSDESASDSNYYDTLAAEVLRDADSDEDLPLKRNKALWEPSIDTSCIEASNNNEQDTLVIPADRIKRRTSSETAADDDATERDQETEKEDVWNFFEKMPSNRAQCILCKESFNRHVPFLTKHLQEKHRKVALNLPSDSDDDQNCYTEVVYLEEEQPIKVPKPKKMKQLPEPRKRMSSSKYEYVSKPKDDIPAYKNESDEEIENFGRYITGLLKKMPKDVSTQLQMDIISMIMTAKLKIGTSTTEANLSVSSVQIVSSDEMATAPGNVIVTTPSSVIHTTQNNESLPTLVIGVQDES